MQEETKNYFLDDFMNEEFIMFISCVLLYLVPVFIIVG